MKRERSYLPQDFFIDRFVYGLKDNIKHTVQCQKPATFLSAYWFARKYEKAYLSSARKNPMILPQHRGVPQGRVPLVRDNRNRAGQDRVREPRKCGIVLKIGH